MEHMASVEFSGMTREEPSAGPNPSGRGRK